MGKQVRVFRHVSYLQGYFIIFQNVAVGSACFNQPQTSMDFRFDV